MHSHSVSLGNKANWRFDDAGFLRVKLRVLKDGVFPYGLGELPEPMRPRFKGKNRVNLRVSSDDFTPDAMKTLEGKPLVIDAPGETHKWREPLNALVDGLQVGNVSGAPWIEDGGLMCEGLVMDPDTIKSITEAPPDSPDHLGEVSAGYDCNLVEDGLSTADMRQTQFRFNHVLLLPEGAGRCGRDVRILNARILNVLPTPEGGEKEADFVSRCMASDVMQAEFPEQDQRAAVCHRQFRAQRSGNAKETKHMIVKIGNKEYTFSSDADGQTAEAMRAANAEEFGAQLKAKDDALTAKDGELAEHKGSLERVHADLAKALADLAAFMSEEAQEKTYSDRKQYDGEESGVVDDTEGDSKKELTAALANAKGMMARKRVIVAARLGNKERTDEQINAAWEALVMGAKHAADIKQRVGNVLPATGPVVPSPEEHKHPVFHRKS